MTMRISRAEAAGRCGVARDRARPQILPHRRRGRDPAAGQLYHAQERFGQLRVGRSRSNLVLPELDIAAGQGFEVGRLGHGADYTRL